MNKSEVFGVVFLDLRKAFDLVVHDTLLKKLTIYLFFKTHVFHHFLLLYIFIKEEPVKYGVPQSALFGPSLFINDLPLHVKNIPADSMKCWQMTTLHTSGTYILEISRICKTS